MTRFLGIDLGTSAIKLLLVDEQQAVLARETEPLTILQPSPLASEQEPEAWWIATAAALTRLHVAYPRDMAGVAAIGISGQMHGAVLLDETDRPIRPAMLWNDGRSYEEAHELNRRGGLAARLGVPAMPGFTAPKLAWLRRHEPESLARARSLMLTADYIRLKLSGERACSVSDAAGTWLLDQERRVWSNEAVAAIGIDPAILPRLVEGSAPAAMARPEIAQRFGLPRDVLIAGGGGDTAVGGVGIGAVEDGTGFVSLGTAAQIFVAGRQYRPAPAQLVHAFCHAVPARWYRMAAMLNGASVLAFAARMLGGADIGTLLAEAEAQFTGPSGLLFLPYLAGERTPLDDPYARGVIFGLSGATSRAQIVLAALEGVAFALADGFAALQEGGGDIAVPGLIGGGTRSRFWAWLMAAIIERPLKRYREGDAGPAFGAARLARMAMGGEDIAAVATEPPVIEVVAPDTAMAARYRPRLEAFRRLYRAVKAEFASG